MSLPYDQRTPEDLGRDLLFSVTHYQFHDQNPFDDYHALECVKNGADLTITVPGRGDTVLHALARDRFGDFGDVAKAVIASGRANLNAQNEAGDTPVMAALHVYNWRIVRQLVEADASLLRKNKAGQTALDVSAQQVPMLADVDVHRDHLRYLREHTEKQKSLQREAILAPLRGLDHPVRLPRPLRPRPR